MEKVLNIKTAEAVAGKGDSVIRTGSVGSCVVISIYDPSTKIGGMAHAMLPTRKQDADQDSDFPAKYVGEAVDYLVKEILGLGGNRHSLVAKIAGGAAMFKKIGVFGNSIGQQNIEAARQKLHELGILIGGEDTGGNSGKVVEMDLRNGIVSISTKI